MSGTVTVSRQGLLFALGMFCLSAGLGYMTNHLLEADWMVFLVLFMQIGDQYVFNQLKWSYNTFTETLVLSILCGIVFYLLASGFIAGDEVTQELTDYRNRIAATGTIGTWVMGLIAALLKPEPETLTDSKEQK